MDFREFPQAVGPEVVNGALIGRLVGVGSKLAVELLPGQLEGPVQGKSPVEQPQVEVEAQRRPLEGVQDVQVDGDGVLDYLLKEVLAEADGAVPESGLVGALGVPPQGSVRSAIRELMLARPRGYARR